jgi:enamine deaminase RidA (YjgF/YER057c/UK114 family)
MAEINIYNPETLDKPLGQYSNVARVKANEILFIAGMLSSGDDFDTQCIGVFAQIDKALKSANAGWATWPSSRPTSCIRRIFQGW